MQKIGFSPSIFFICFNETPLKIMKNAFYFILKALFVLKVFKFLSWLFGHESLVTGRWSLVKIRLISKLSYWFRDMFNVDSLEKGLGIVSPANFVYAVSRKMFLILYSINWPNFIVRLPFLLEILGNMCIAIVCFLGCDVINFEINHLIFQI